MTKSEVRAFIKEIKRNLTDEKIITDSEIISKKLFGTQAYKQCTQLFCYVSYNQEVRTATIIKTALQEGKKVAVPKIIGNEMKFYSIESLEELRPGILGILEPVTQIENEDKTITIKEEVILDKGEKSLFIVPGLAFDINKNRIGYGKGYYDYYFSRFGAVNFDKIAFAFDFQVLTELPVGEYDKKIDLIITETRIIT